MLGIKRLYSYMLQRFLPLLLMTFFICLFIVLMQFLWRSIDDLVGKGLSVGVICELFFYAAITMVPMALPLAVLLASLMVFGNLGEKFELTAMKAGGISLFRIMRPLTVFIVILAIGAFFFQNDIYPLAQTRMYTLIFSVRQKTPEVEIPERSFYDQIPNINLYVERKNSETGMLYGMIIYDTSRGMDNMRVIMADSGRFNFTEDKTRLFLHLHSGEMFENMRENDIGNTTTDFQPFRREHFSDKQFYFPFDANFNRMDEAGIRSQYVGQNITQLRQSIDSIGRQVDSIGAQYANQIKSQPYFGLVNPTRLLADGTKVTDTIRDVHPDAPLNIDSLFQGPDPGSAKSYVAQALAKAKRQRQDYQFRSAMLSDQAKLMRRHDIEMQRKFTLSFAIIIFFFIGAPLGAIIKKGGLGTPLVISVFLFIVYYIIDNAGFKMAREGRMSVTLGIWLSSIALLPLGIFFTYKAARDSVLFNLDSYIIFFKRMFGKGQQRSLTIKEVRMTEVDTDRALDQLRALAHSITDEQEYFSRQPFYRRLSGATARRTLQSELDTVVEYLSNSTDNYVISYINEYPFLPTRRNIGEMAETTARLIDHLTQKNSEPHNNNEK